MKMLRKTTAAALLACLLALPVSAGDMYGGFTNPPPPPPSQSTDEASGETGNALTEVITSLLGGLYNNSYAARPSDFMVKTLTLWSTQTLWSTLCDKSDFRGKAITDARRYRTEGLENGCRRPALPQTVLA